MAAFFMNILMCEKDKMKDEMPADNQAPTLWDTIKSVAAAFFGVQNRANRVRDFKHGKASHFIIIGLMMTVLLVLTIVGIVKLVLHLTGV